VLEHAGNTDAAIFAALGRGAPALLETVVIGEPQRLLEHAREVAAVDGGAHRRLVGQG